MCKTLSRSFRVYLIVADGKGNELFDNIEIIDIGKQSRVLSILRNQPNLYNVVKSINANIYHFHDPELLPFALKMQKAGYKFIYDVHEDLPLDIFNKDKIPQLFRPLISFFVKKYENYSVKRLSFVVTATDHIKNKLAKSTNKVVSIKNYPDLNVDYFNDIQYTKNNSICYLGLLNKSRGILELLNVIKISNVHLNLAGRFVNPEFQSLCESSEGWLNTSYYGNIPQHDSISLMRNSAIGMMLHHPNKAYSYALPIKLLEYMACGLPIIVSDYPICREILGESNCGYLVNVFDEEKIKTHIHFLLNNPDIAEQMGMEGRKLVETKYNWINELNSLESVYYQILNSSNEI